MKRTLFAAAALVCAAAALAQEPTPIRFGRGFAAEEQVWLMSARPDLAPNQGKKYQLKQILVQANPARFQAYLAGELDAGTAPGLAVIFARAQGVDMKVVASICLEAAGSQWFSTTYMVKDDGPIRNAKDQKGGTVDVFGYKSSSHLWARSHVLNSCLLPHKDSKSFSFEYPSQLFSVPMNEFQSGSY